MKLQTHSHGWGFRNLLVFALIFQVRKARLRKSRDLPKATWVDRAELRLGLVTLSSVPFLLPQGWRGLQGPAQRFPPPGTITREISSPLKGHLRYGKEYQIWHPSRMWHPAQQWWGWGLGKASMPGPENGPGTRSWLHSMSC